MPDNEPADRYEKPGAGNDPQFAGVRERFLRMYGADDADDNPLNDAPIEIVKTPGRLNLIGEHVDYNDGVVFPMAIEPHITLAFRRRNDAQIRVATDANDDGPTTFTVDTGKGEPPWTNYLRGPVALLREKGEVLSGADILLTSSLPVGAGLSSSAALEVGMTRLMLHLAGGEMDDVAVAKLGQRAEQEYAGVKCGIMDQTIVASGRKGHAMMLDCRTMERTFVPLPGDDVAVVVCDTRGEHALGDSGYNARVESCQTAARALGVSSLRDASIDDLEAKKDQMDDETYRRARHVVTEIARVQQFADALNSKDYEKAGELMYASHDSLRDDYEVSSDRLNALVEAARSVDGVYGARLTGAGFGGCAIALCRPDAADAAQDAMAAAMQEQFGVKTVPFVTTATDGARVVD